MPDGQLYVTPAVPGAVVRDPVTRQVLPAEGGWVPDNVHWRRRLPRAGITPIDVRAGIPDHDVVLAEPPGEAARGDQAQPPVQPLTIG